MDREEEEESLPIHTQVMHSMRDQYYQIIHSVGNNIIILLLSSFFKLHQSSH